MIIMDERIEQIDRLHDQFAGVLYDKCFRFLGDRLEAEDAVQDTFVRAYLALKRFRKDSPPQPWLFRIATNVCLNKLRTRRRKGLVPIPDIDKARFTPANQMDLVTLRQTIQYLERTIDHRSLEIFIAYYLDGANQVEIAQSLGISRRAVVKRLSRLKNHLKQYWEGKDHE